jgi:hypothetical protein
MNAREFRISRGPFLKELAKDTDKMSASAFKRKHGVDVRECRNALKRLRKLADAGNGEDDEEIRKLVGLFAAIWERQAV